MFHGYDSRDSDPAERAIAREGSPGFVFATVALFLLLLAILTVFAFTFLTSTYCPPGAYCDVAQAAPLLRG
jgi:hypothetical protein